MSGLSDPLDLLTFCVLVLRNGFTVTGESACASPENFDADVGRKIARQNAVQKVWPLLGFQLRTDLHGGRAYSAAFPGELPTIRAAEKSKLCAEDLEDIRNTVLLAAQNSPYTNSMADDLVADLKRLKTES